MWIYNFKSTDVSISNWMSSWLNQTFHAPLHAIGKMAITFVWQFVQFQINNHFIPYEPAISVSPVSIQWRKYFASYRAILIPVV